MSAAAYQLAGMPSQRRHLLLAGVSATLLLIEPRIVVAASPAANGLATLLDRLRLDFIANLGSGNAATFARTMAAGHRWADIDYSDRAVGRWRAVVHLERLRAMAVGIHRPGHALFGSREAAMAVGSGLRTWLVLKPQSDNWWQNTIGQQLALMPILVLMRDDLPADVLLQATALLQDPGMVPAARATGQNLVWYATQQLVRGALRADADDLLQARLALLSMLMFTATEGIQADYSFHQHGSQLYSGGYGLGFLIDIVRLSGLLADTPWALAQNALERLADYGLFGIAPLVRGDWLDWGARGREFTRVQSVPLPRLVARALAALATLVPNRRSALADVAGRLGSGKPEGAVLGNRWYWRSDFMVHQTTRGYVSVKMSSARTYGTESGNGENLLGYWLPFGVTYLLRRGDEYQGLPAVWDWSALPGLTAPTEVPGLTGLQRHPVTFVGGLSNGRSGMAAMRLDKLQTQARKAWFIHGDTLVALGSGIRSERDKPVRTTLNQTRFKGNVFTAGGRWQPGQSKHLRGLAWVWHDGVSYWLAEGTEADFGVTRRKANRQAINLELGGAAVDADVWLMQIEHGVRPSGANYGYAIRFEPEAPDSAPVRPAHQVLANTESLQVVRQGQDGPIQAVFWATGEITWDNRWRLAVSAPCLVMLTPQATEWQVQAVDPTRLLARVEVSLSRDGQRVSLQVLQASPAADTADPTSTWQAPRT